MLAGCWSSRPVASCVNNRSVASWINRRHVSCSVNSRLVADCVSNRPVFSCVNSRQLDGCLNSRPVASWKNMKLFFLFLSSFILHTAHINLMAILTNESVTLWINQWVRFFPSKRPFATQKSNKYWGTDTFMPPFRSEFYGRRTDSELILNTSSVSDHLREWINQHIHHPNSIPRLILLTNPQNMYAPKECFSSNRPTGPIRS